MDASSASLPASADAPVKGIAFLVAGVSLFTFQDVIVKLLSNGYPAHQIVFLRGLVALIPLLKLHLHLLQKSLTIGLVLGSFSSWFSFPSLELLS